MPKDILEDRFELGQLVVVYDSRLQSIRYLARIKGISGLGVVYTLAVISGPFKGCTEKVLDNRLSLPTEMELVLYGD